MPLLRPSPSPPSLAFRLGLALAAALLFTAPWLELGNLRVQDGLFHLRRQLSRTEAPAPEVVLVGIDEETLRALPEPLALFHRPLGGFLEAMVLARPAAVGLDLALPDRSVESLLPGRDAALLRGLLAMRPVAPVVLGRVTGAHGQPRALHPPFEAAAGPAQVGYLLFQEDSDRRVRRFESRLLERDGEAPTFAGILAATQGASVRNGTLDMALGAPFAYVPLHQVLTWREQGRIDALTARFQGRMVLLGSVLPFEDRIKLSAPLASWESPETGTAPGVVLQAQTLRCLLAGRILAPLPAWGLVAAAFGCGLAGIALGRRPLPGLAGLALLLAALPIFAFWALGLGWTLPVLGGAGALLTGFLGRVSRDLLRERQAADRDRVRAEAEQEYFRSLALRDGLTGLANRRALDERLQQEWQRCARSGSSLAVLLGDLDHFKRLNDSLGHQGGDDCLRRVSAAMTTAILRPSDLLARYGGEEFAVLLPETDEAGALQVAERLLRAVRDLQLPHPDSPVAPFVTLSVGAAATVPRAEDPPERLLTEADAMLYRSKEHGRNQVTGPSSPRPTSPAPGVP